MTKPFTPHDYADYFPQRANLRVDGLKYDAYVTTEGFARVEYGQLPAASANAIINAQDIATAITKGGTIVKNADWDKIMGPWGRNVSLSLSGAGTPTVTVNGLDYLGQPMSENIVAAGATGVAGKKAFKVVTNITTAAVAGTTLSLGTGNVVGIPYAAVKLEGEYVNGDVPAAGTFVKSTLSTPQTATTGDPRGTYSPAAGVVFDGTREHQIVIAVWFQQLHGLAHFFAG